MSPLVLLMLGALGVILIFFGYTIAKQKMEKQRQRFSAGQSRTTLGKDLSDE